jgi:hypothetical protein
VYGAGLAVVGRAFIPALEAAPATRYVVDRGTVAAHRPTWLPQQKRMAPLIQPLWRPAANFGVPLLLALIAATPGWPWRTRGAAMAVGLSLLTLTQIAFLLVTIVATQQSPVPSPDGPIRLPGYSPTRQPVFYGLYYFFEIMGRGFFSFLIYFGLVESWWKAPRMLPGTGVGRNDPCPCGSGLKYKRCCQA